MSKTIFGNVRNFFFHKVGPTDAEFLEKRFQPVFKAVDIMKLDNYNAYMSMLVNGQPTKPFNMHTLAPEAGNPELVDNLKELSYLKYGRDRAGGSTAPGR